MYFIRLHHRFRSRIVPKVEHVSINSDDSSFSVHVMKGCTIATSAESVVSARSPHITCAISSSLTKSDWQTHQIDKLN